MSMCKSDSILEGGINEVNWGNSGDDGGRGAEKGKYYELNGGKGVDTEKIPVALKNKRTHGDTPCKKA